MFLRFSLVCLVAVTVATSGAANAAVTTCQDFTAANGTSVFPGTYVGAVGSGVGQVCQIGNLSMNGSSGTGTFVNNTQPTSIYSFFWSGGLLSITERLGNNGLGEAVEVTLDMLASKDSTSPGTTLAAVSIPFTSGPSATYTLASALLLTAGYYAIDTQLVPTADDPTFQINFTPVPEPATAAILAGSLAVLPLVRRKRARQA